MTESFTDFEERTATEREWGEAPFDYWVLCDYLPAFHIVMFAIGRDPEGRWSNEIESRVDRPRGYEAVARAIKRAILDGKIKTAPDTDLSYSAIDLDMVNVDVESAKDFLRSKGFTRGYLFANKENRPDYLDRNHLNYAPKLAAAVNAWQTINANSDLLKGKTPKQAIDKWLRQHANEYGLTKDDGNPNETAIEEISKMANWKPEGGAAKTPGNANPPTPIKAVENK